MPEYNISRVPNDWFKGAHTHGEEVLKEQEEVYYIKGEPCQPDSNGYGCYTWYEGIPFPRKSAYDQDFLAYVNIIKRITLGLVRVVGSKEIILPAIGFAILPWSKKLNLINKFLLEWHRMAEFTMRPAMWKDEKRWCPVVREWQKFILIFLKDLGIKSNYDDLDLPKALGEDSGTIIENDDSYRYRIQDIFGEIDLQRLNENPSKEVRRVFDIYKQREHGGIDDKFEAIVRSLTLALRIPKIRRSFLFAIDKVDLQKLALDESDKYWAFKKTNYNFCGMNNAQKEFYFNNIHRGVPPPSVLLRS